MVHGSSGAGDLDVVLHLFLQQPSIVVAEVLLQVKDLLDLAADFFLADIGSA